MRTITFLHHDESEAHVGRYSTENSQVLMHQLPLNQLLNKFMGIIPRLQFFWCISVLPLYRFLSTSGIGSTRNGCPPVLVARRQASSEQQCNTEQELSAAGRQIVPVHIGEETSGSPHRPEPSRSTVEDEGDGEREEPDGRETGGSGDEVTESEDVASTPSRAVKHKAVEQRRKKKITDAVQQLLEALQPPSPAGKMVCGLHNSHSPCN